MRYMIMGVLLGVIGFITACGGGSGTGTTTTESVTPAPETTEVTEPAVELPALADLPRTATGTAVTSLNGADYSDDLLHFRVERSDDTAIFSPTGKALAESALATYTFNLTGVTDDQDLVLNYDNLSNFTLDTTTCWMALANWDRHTWEWHRAIHRNYINIGDPAPYTHPVTGTCYLIMLYQSNNTEIRLNSLGFQLASSDGGAGWAHTFLSQGERTSMRVCEVDQQGYLYLVDPSYEFDTDDDLVDVYRISPEGEVLWAYSYDLSYLEGYTLMRSPKTALSPAGELYLTLCLELVGQPGVDTFLKLDQDGNVLWHKRFTPDDNLHIYSIAVNSQGTLHACGLSNYDAARDMLLLQIDPSGAITNQRYYDWNAGYLAEGRQVFFDAEDKIYVVSSLRSNTSDCSVGLSKFDSMGTVIRHREITNDYIEGFVFNPCDELIYQNGRGNEITVYNTDLEVVRACEITGNDPYLRAFCTDASGNLILCGQLGYPYYPAIACITPDLELAWMRLWEIEAESWTTFNGCCPAPENDFYLYAEATSPAGCWRNCTSEFSTTPLTVSTGGQLSMTEYTGDHVLVDEEYTRTETQYFSDELDAYDGNLVIRYSP